MVSRSTCQLFGCDYKLPTANYPLEQAIADHNLVPFRVVAHTTKFLRDGIKAAHLTDEQIAQLEDQGIDPNTLDFDAQEIDAAVFNRDTNRVILRNLMDNGLRDADGQLPGKSIVFARNIYHARLLAELFDEVAGRLGHAPLVIDSGDIRQNPRLALSGLCAALGVPFADSMLHWAAGPKPYDGVWAPHWYGAVHRSTGFEDPEGPLPDLTGMFGDLVQQALPFYHKLRAFLL